MECLSQPSNCRASRNRIDQLKLLIQNNLTKTCVLRACTGSLNVKTNAHKAFELFLNLGLHRFPGT
jgi:hypothetical protein